MTTTIIMVNIHKSETGGPFKIQVTKSEKINSFSLSHREKKQQRERFKKKIPGLFSYLKENNPKKLVQCLYDETTRSSNI